MKDSEKLNLITRRSFIGASSAALTAAAAISLDLNAFGADKRSDRLRYDVSKFSVTDPKLIKYEEKSRLAQAGKRARRISATPGGFMVACEGGAQEFSSAGARLREFATPTAARCAAVAADGAVYVGTREGIYVFDKTGIRTGFWPVASKKSWFTGLAVGENDLFAADSGNRLVVRFDRSGKELGQIGEKNQERNVPGIVLPSPYLHVALGSDGLLRVNNTGRHRVELYTPDGDLELTWGKPSIAIEGFCGCCNPVGLAMFADGRCVTAEKGLPRVKVYSSDGKLESVVAGPESYPENTRHGAARDATDGTMGGLDVAVTSSGTVYVLDLVTAVVHMMQPKKS